MMLHRMSATFNSNLYIDTKTAKPQLLDILSDIKLDKVLRT